MSVFHFLINILDERNWKQGGLALSPDELSSMIKKALAMEEEHRQSDSERPRLGGKTLREYRKKYRLTLVDVDDVIPIGVAVISSIERGIRPPLTCDQTALLINKFGPIDVFSEGLSATPKGDK